MDKKQSARNGLQNHDVMSARIQIPATTTPHQYQCAEPSCICISRIVQVGRRIITPNVLMRKDGKEIRLCLLCWFGYRVGWGTRGFQFVQLFQNKVD